MSVTRSALLGRMATVALVVLAADRITKWWVVEGLELHRLGRIEIFPPFLNFVMAWNTGINFGLLGGISPDRMRWALTVLAVAISAALAVWVWRRAGTGQAGALAVGAGIVAGGALGNAWDRIQYGAVADFLNMSCCGIDNPYAFNIADVAIFAGAALIALRA